MWEPTLSAPCDKSLIKRHYDSPEGTIMFVINQNGRSGRFGYKNMNNFEINTCIYIFAPKSAGGSTMVRWESLEELGPGFNARLKLVGIQPTKGLNARNFFSRFKF